MRSGRYVALIAVGLSIAVGGMVSGSEGPTPQPAPADPGPREEIAVPPTDQELQLLEENLQNATDGPTVPCTSVEQDLNYPNYWVGQSFEGLRLAAVIRQCDAAPEDGAPNRTNLVSYLYGSCPASDDQGCAVPIEIQTWPLEERNREMYTSTPSKFLPAHEYTTFNSFPAIRFDSRLEIFYSNATVAIFGDDEAQIDRAAAALHRGPVVLAELASHGLVFSTQCVEDLNYCVARPTAK